MRERRSFICERSDRPRVQHGCAGGAIRVGEPRDELSECEPDDPTVIGHLRLGGVLQPITPTGPIELGEPDVGENKGSTAGAIEPSGTLSAINVNNGQIEWQYHSDYPMLGGVTATAGNLVFAGEFDGNFDAFNATTGQKLWHFQMGAGVMASPVTYMVNGRQYVAVAAGGNAANGNPILMKKLGFHSGDEIAIFAVSPLAQVVN